MKNIKGKSIIPFAGERIFIVSPVKLGDDKSHNEFILNSLLTRLKTSPQIRFEGGIITIRKTSAGILHEDQFWGGVGISVLISANYDAADLSEAIGKHVVVLDHLADKFFKNGAEIRRPATIHKIRPEPAV